MGSVGLNQVCESESVRLRPAVAADARLLFEWVNRPDSVAGKLETVEPISWERHQAWFVKRLAADGCVIWIAEREDTPVGQVRAERRDDGRLHIDIYVTAPARRGGVGAAMLNGLTNACAARWPGTPLVARVRSGNAPSRRLFEKTGFRLIESAADHCVYVKA